MDSDPIQQARAYFQDQFGLSLDALLDPIDASMPAGKPLRGGSVYAAIEQARRQDDPSLPMGAWERDLKRAEWDKVGAVAVDALRGKSKDLQLAGWLLEAQINRDGFAGIGPCLVLMRLLCERYWDTLHPLAEDGDLEYRANIFHWADRKLLPALRMVPLTAAGREQEFAWADWEQARRNEQLRAAAGTRDAAGVEGPGVADILAAMQATPSATYARLHRELSCALEAGDALGTTLDRLFGRDAPGLTSLSGLLEQVLSLADSELHKRGVQPALEPEPLPQEPDAEPPAADAPQEERMPSTRGAIRDRADAYARLNEAAEFLMRLEPHSPVPYLVKRATEWGQLNTVELYQELFLRLGGQISIFEMLGLDAREHDGQTG